MIEARAYARVGLAGNPSDAYFGKCLAVTIKDFSARVWFEESDRLEIVPSPDDAPNWASIDDLVLDVKMHGFYGGERLMKAAIRRFADYCGTHGHALHDRPFRLRYESTIPRRLGMAGSSALVTATLRCLMQHYNVDIPKPVLASLILGVENEDLGISGGLMDRVVQVYEGLVFMDFDKRLMEEQGHGRYERLDVAALPPLYIAYRTDLAEGSEVFHNTIRERWLQNDPEILQAMNDFAEYAQEVRDLLAAGRGDRIGVWMDRNFDRRRSWCHVAKVDVRMVEQARSVGASAKFAGSGGAIVGTYADEAMYERLVEVYKTTATEVFKPELHAPEPVAQRASDR